MIRRAVKINAKEEQLPDTVWAIEASDTEYPTMASVEGYAMDEKTANLYAAAPELMAVLEQMVETFGACEVGNNYIGRDSMEQARAAIAKARGAK